MITFARIMSRASEWCQGARQDVTVRVSQTAFNVLLSHAANDFGPGVRAARTFTFYGPCGKVHVLGVDAEGDDDGVVAIESAEHSAVVGADALTRSERMERALAWFDRAVAEEKTIERDLAKAEQGLVALQSAQSQARGIREACFDAITCAVGNADYVLGGKPWRPPWEPSVELEREAVTCCGETLGSGDVCPTCIRVVR